MKNLKIIQTIAKIGKILSQVAFVCCIVAVSLCSLAFLTLILLPQVDLTKLLIEEGETNIETLYASLIVAIVVCASEIYVAFRSKKFFIHELEIGHPFTHEIAGELKKLAWITIIINIVTSFVCEIGIAIANYINPAIKDINMSFASIGFGLTLLFIAILCDYGSDIADGYVQLSDTTTTDEKTAD